MTTPSFMHRENLGWLIPILLFFIFFGGYLWVHESQESLQRIGILFCLGGILGLSFSRRVRRLVGYHMRRKTEERRIRFTAAVEMDKARRRAFKEGIPELICELYFTHLVHYPENFESKKGSHAVIIPDIVTRAVRESGNRIAIEFDKHRYIFTFVHYVYNTPDGERLDEATLQVSSPEQKLFLVHLAMRLWRGRKELRPITLEYIILSDWVNDMRNLHDAIRKKHREEWHEDRM